MLSSGTIALGPDDGAIEIRVAVEGPVSFLAHDLVIDLGAWNADVDVDDAEQVSAIGFTADLDQGRYRLLKGSDPVREGPRKSITKTITKMIGHAPIGFRSERVADTGDDVVVGGELTLVGVTRPIEFTLHRSGGRIRGQVAINQTEWAIPPVSHLFGAIRTSETVELVVDVAWPAQ
ncbi:MAG TPA: YceI family protein [Solirubrobacteraceae bacterium]|nr:YceI family protein [Solirubrobacteraceae bacterium]